MKLLHQGSVKDIYQHSDGKLAFRFSNRYSIFDWGEMPDQIPGKGAALATMGDLLMSELARQGVKTHYLGRGEAKEDLLVKEVKVPRGNMDVYRERPNSILIPLEVIFRFGVPKGSSLIKKGYREGEEFLEPKIDFTTKLERLDRPLTPDEARELAGMNEQEWNNLYSSTQLISKKLKIIFDQAGFKLWDGKLEFAFDEHRQIMLVDSIGLDEIRLTFQGDPLSKELLRQCYLETEWYRALAVAKQKSPGRFKEYCLEVLNERPSPLPEKVIQAMSNIYLYTSQLILNEDQSEIKKLQQKLSEQLKVLKGVK